MGPVRTRRAPAPTAASTPSPAKFGREPPAAVPGSRLSIPASRLAAPSRGHGDGTSAQAGRGARREPPRCTPGAERRPAGRAPSPATAAATASRAPSARPSAPVPEVLGCLSARGRRRKMAAGPGDGRAPRRHAHAERSGHGAGCPADPGRRSGAGSPATPGTMAEAADRSDPRLRGLRAGGGGDGFT